MSIRKPLVGLSIFLILAVMASSLVFVSLRREVSGPTNTYSALFTDVSGMHPGDDVRVAGVRVGRVDRVELRGTIARVTFRVQKDQPLFTNTTASVTYQNIIGQRYLGLLPGASGEQRILPNGSTIPLDRTNPSFDIAYLLNGFEPLFTTLDPQKVDDLTSAIIAAFQGDTGSVLSLITQTSALAESFAGPDDLLGGTISSLNDVVSNLSNQTGLLQKTLRQTAGVLANLDSRRDDLVASVGSINATASRLATIMVNIFPEVQELIRRQPGFATYILQHPDGVAYMAQNTPALLKAVARTNQYGAYGTTYVCDVYAPLPTDVYGRIMVGLIKLASPGNVLQHSAVCR
jgi:phospholipid/cholesterol/gamma-HCH transport system substrate-binding protein